MDEEYELVEGKLHLKHTDGGWRHYIRVGQDDRDIHCGAYMEVCLGEYRDDGSIRRDRWLTGRYEASLIGEMSQVKARLEITLYPIGDAISVNLPVGALVRVKK